jgi:hypothetical protein
LLLMQMQETVRLHIIISWCPAPFLFPFFM